MSLKIAICDDTKTDCEEIKKHILELKPDYSIDIFYSGTDLLAAKNTYDIIFMDIEMPDLDGLKTSFILRERKRNDFIIFLTSHWEIMSETFKVKAFRFLNKPIEQAHFEEALLNAEEEILNNRQIIVTTNKVSHSLHLNDIICFEAFGDGTFIYTTQAEALTTGKSLKYWHDLLGTEHFFQTHKSYLVNLRHINIIKGYTIEIPEPKLSIPISRRHYAELKTVLQDYIRTNAHYV